MTWFLTMETMAPGVGEYSDSRLLRSGSCFSPGLLNGCVALIVDVFLEEIPQLFQAVGNARDQLEHPPEPLLLETHFGFLHVFCDGILPALS